MGSWHEWLRTITNQQGFGPFSKSQIITNNHESMFSGSLFVQAVPRLILILMHRMSLSTHQQLLLLMQLLPMHPRSQPIEKRTWCCGRNVTAAKMGSTFPDDMIAQGNGSGETSKSSTHKQAEELAAKLMKQPSALAAISASPPKKQKIEEGPDVVSLLPLRKICSKQTLR